MPFTPPKEVSNQVKVYKIIEIVIHLFLIIIIPVIFLEVTTGFNKYDLPDYINYVYGYWLIYLIVTPLFYNVFKKKRKYKKFRRK
jgi:hypothetical protein